MNANKIQLMKEKLIDDIRKLADKYKYVHNFDKEFYKCEDEEVDFKKYIQIRFYNNLEEENVNNIYVEIGQIKILCDEIDEESTYYQYEEREFAIPFNTKDYNKSLEEVEQAIIKCNEKITYFK
jgi:hypothetical protein